MFLKNSVYNQEYEMKRFFLQTTCGKDRAFLIFNRRENEYFAKKMRNEKELDNNQSEFVYKCTNIQAKKLVDLFDYF